MPESVVYNCDCLEYMRTLPDNAFQIAIVDPPYGAGFTEGGGCKGWFTKYHQNTEDTEACSQILNVERERAAVQPGRKSGEHLREVQASSKPLRFHGGDRWDRYIEVQNRGKTDAKKIIAWDVAPGEDYFRELFRVSRNQIIWGGNYFALPPTRCFIVWKKLTISENFTMAMAEYAWTSFNKNAKVFEGAPQGRPGDPRWHPTAKPIALYKFCLKHFAQPGDKILDTHLGSGSSRIAAWDMGFDFVGCEIDRTYFELEEKRFGEYTRQLRLF